jgi:hypothetical protein
VSTRAVSTPVIKAGPSSANRQAAVFLCPAPPFNARTTFEKIGYKLPYPHRVNPWPRVNLNLAMHRNDLLTLGIAVQGLDRSRLCENCLVSQVLTQSVDKGAGLSSPGIACNVTRIACIQSIKMRCSVRTTTAAHAQLEELVAIVTGTATVI